MSTLGTASYPAGVVTYFDATPDREGPANTETETVYLVWSNEASKWWGPNGHNYTHDVWSAGRYSYDEAVKACGMRTWSEGAVPPEVKVPAPECGKTAMTLEEIRAVPGLMRNRIDAATREAISQRTASLGAVAVKR